MIKINCCICSPILVNFNKKEHPKSAMLLKNIHETKSMTNIRKINSGFNYIRGLSTAYLKINVKAFTNHLCLKTNHLLLNKDDRYLSEVKCRSRKDDRLNIKSN